MDNLVLKVIAGVHAGGQCRFKPGELVLLGSHSDCDVVLTDDGVEAHHCVLGLNAGDIVLRALDGDVVVDGKVLATGDRLHVKPFQRLVIGHATGFALGPAGDERWSKLEAPDDRGRSAVRPALKTAAIAGGAVAAVGTGLLFATALLTETVEPAMAVAGPADVAAALDAMHLPEVRLTGDGGDLAVTGLVRDEAALKSLRSTLRKLGVPVRVDVRSGADLSNDVREVLRLSGIRAQTRYDGGGRVAVDAPGADARVLAAVIESRAMLEIDGLNKVLVNRDPPQAAMPSPDGSVPSGKKIVSVVGGKDPYLVTADGSRYYVGARLPGGGRLHAIDDEAVWIETGDGLERLAPSSTHVSRSSS